MTRKAKSPIIETKVVLQQVVSTPVGQLKLSSFLAANRGIPVSNMRVLGSYAIVYVLNGSGFYQDALRKPQKVATGDLLVLFPELAHAYGPRPGETWSEFFVVFDGQVFDLWRNAGWLDATHPLRHVGAVDKWLPQFEVWSDAALQYQAPPLLLARFLELLTALLHASTHDEQSAKKDWLNEAKRLLGSDLNRELNLNEVARGVGLNYESFRKRFAQETGVAPAHYRAQKRIEAAQALLQYADLPHKAIAATLGFADEFHFCKRFKQLTGQTPREFRLSEKLNTKAQRHKESTEL